MIWFCLNFVFDGGLIKVIVVLVKVFNVSKVIFVVIIVKVKKVF